MNSESNDADECRQSDEHKAGNKGGRQIFEAIVVLQENEKFIIASSVIEGMDEE